MKRIIALVYQSYVFKKFSIPYVRALMVLILSVIILLSIILGSFKLNFVNPFGLSDKAGINLLIGGLFVFLLLGVCSLLFKKRDLEEYHFTEKQLKHATTYIAVYFLALILLLLATLILRARHVI